MLHFSIMKDRKGNSRGKCLKPSCDCDDYTVEKNFCLCAYCEHTPAAHGITVLYSVPLLSFLYSSVLVFTVKTGLRFAEIAPG